VRENLHSAKAYDRRHSCNGQNLQESSSVHLRAFSAIHNCPWRLTRNSPDGSS
jgi:hypothetical protein